MSLAGAIAQLLEITLALAGAPLLLGWVDQCRARLQNRSAPPLIQPYRVLRKLFHKECVIAGSASPLFRIAPYAKFGCMARACAMRSGVQGDGRDRFGMSMSSRMRSLLRRACTAATVRWRRRAMTSSDSLSVRRARSWASS